MKLFEVLLTVLATAYVEASFKLAGPYEIELLMVDPCETESAGPVEYSTKITKKSKTEKVWSSNLTLPCDLDENTKTIVEVSKWGSGGWQQNAYHLDQKAPCGWMEKFLPDFFAALLSAGNIPAECPIKAGNYSLQDFPTKWEKQDNFPSLPYGKYKAEMQTYCGDVMFYCVMAHVDVTEIPLT